MDIPAKAVRDWVSPSGRLMKSPATRFWAKVDQSGGPDACWLWTGALAGLGYGSFSVNRRMVKAHRWAYEALVGPIPDGLQLDHLCRVKRCVNPAHLEPVTQRENILRSDSPSAKAARQTHCVHGHALTPDNIYRVKGYNKRFCRRCKIDRAVAYQRVYRARKKAARALVP